MLEAFVQALKYLAHIETILLILLGNIIGLVFGALPGLGGVTALAIMLPFTFGMDPMVAMFFLSANIDPNFKSSFQSHSAEVPVFTLKVITISYP